MFDAMPRVRHVKNTVADISKQFPWPVKLSTKGSEHWQLRGHRLVEYKSESNNILLTLFQKGLILLALWELNRCIPQLIVIYLHQPKAKITRLPFLCFPLSRKKKGNCVSPTAGDCSKCLRKRQSSPIPWFTARKSFALTTIQTCLVRANCFHFPLASYISYNSNLTLLKIKKMK